MKSAALVLITLAIAAMTSALRAAVVDLYIPSITGEDNPPGFTGAMRTTSVTIAPTTYSIDKHTDSASPQIANAVVAGTHLGTSRMLFYNVSPPAGAQPDQILLSHNLLGTSLQNLSGGDIGRERDTFAYATVTPEPASGFVLAIGMVSFAVRRRR